MIGRCVHLTLRQIGLTKNLREALRFLQQFAEKSTGIVTEVN